MSQKDQVKVITPDNQILIFEVSEKGASDLIQEYGEGWYSVERIDIDWGAKCLLKGTGCVAIVVFRGDYVSSLMLGDDVPWVDIPDLTEEEAERRLKLVAFL